MPDATSRRCPSKAAHLTLAHSACSDRPSAAAMPRASASLADQLRGTFVDQRGGRLTFDEWVGEWLAAKPDQRAATLARDRSAIGTHFSPAIGHRPTGRP